MRRSYNECRTWLTLMLSHAVSSAVHSLSLASTFSSRFGLRPSRTDVTSCPNLPLTTNGSIMQVRISLSWPNLPLTTRCLFTNGPTRQVRNNLTWPNSPDDKRLKANNKAHKANDASSQLIEFIVWWRDYMRFFLTLIFLVFDESVTDGRTDRRTDRPSYRDARTHLKTNLTWPRKDPWVRKSRA